MTLADAKVHLKVEDATDDGLIRALIGAAAEYAETFTRRRLLTQTWDLKLDDFPCAVIELPFPPVSSVTSVSYVDTAGDTQTWSSALYTATLPVGPQAAPATIEPIYGESFPSTRSQSSAVTVRFVCGYGAASDLPSSIVAAMKLLIGHWYVNREAAIVSMNTATSVIPMGVDQLLWPYRL
jgi:uncharacterized phiE125 gp8 family phage protein